EIPRWRVGLVWVVPRWRVGLVWVSLAGASGWCGQEPSLARRAGVRRRSAHHAVTVWRFDRVILVEAPEPQLGDVERSGLAVYDQFGHQLTDDGRHFEAVPAETDRAVAALQSG